MRVGTSGRKGRPYGCSGHLVAVVAFVTVAPIPVFVLLVAVAAAKILVVPMSFTLPPLIVQTLRNYLPSLVLRFPKFDSGFMSFGGARPHLRG